MRKLSVLILLAIFVFACGNRQNQTTATEDAVIVLTVDELLASAAENVDKEIVISGLITHVCKHGGQRCFVMGLTDDITIRVEAGDEIESFKQEHVGDVLQITGILRLVPVDGGHVCSEEEEAAHEHEAGTEETVVAATETDSEEAYVPTYFIDGLKFIVLTEGPETTEEKAEEV
jgi:hypothetical protein